MNSKAKIALGSGLIVAAIALGLGFNSWSSAEQVKQDQSSLTAQRKLAGGGNGNGAGGPMGGLMADLNLTDAQQAKMKEAQAKMRKSFETMGKNGKPGPEQMKQMGAQMQAQREKMEAILTPEQRAKMQEKMKAMMGNMPMPGGANGAAGGGMPPMPMGGMPFGGGQQ